MQAGKVSFFRHYFLITLTSAVFFLFVGFVTVGHLFGGGPAERDRMENYFRAIKSRQLTASDFDQVYEMLMRRERDAPYAFLILGFAVSLSIASSAAAMMFYLRKKARLASQVMGEIKAGKLDARFPTERVDAFTHLMDHFNEMAEQIKSLVLKLKDVDQSRKILLQEISHDLKTPLSSLLLSLDALERRHDVSEEKRAQFVAEARSETDYIARLLEDLLFLSVVEDPAFKIHATPFNLSSVVEELIRLAQIKYPGVEVAFEKRDDVPVHADAILFKRALRNLVENAFSFAKTKVVIFLSASRLEITDDGPGFKAEILANYGKQRLNNLRSTDGAGGRNSTGLGAVIADRILSFHNMKVVAANVVGDGGRVSGARLCVLFGDQK